MSRRAIRNGIAALVLVLIPGAPLLSPSGSTRAGRVASRGSPASLFDDRLENVRKASVGWENRAGPERRVVDVVCLVHGLPEFLEALATWDEGIFFPILLDDEPELVFRFVRAFRPAQVVRFGGPAPGIEPDRIWERSAWAVGQAWAGPAGYAPPDAPGGEERPRRLGRTPPGIVVTSPTSPLLAGGLALAAGHFQPLLRWEPEPAGRFRDLLSEDDAERLAAELEARIADRITSTGALGDGCDFVTLAGDWPYSYRTPEGPNAFDDLVCHSPETHKRSAYVGRLVGSPAAGVFQAMCSLFLPAGPALLFNAYDDKDDGSTWSAYQMRLAAYALAGTMQVAHRSGPQEASLAGWHEAFDPVNRFSLVMINSSGTPTEFRLQDAWGETRDVPWSAPAAVVQIHSHSADDPTDPNTIAGRWLANGAFVYFGAMNEPYLQAFRTPSLVAALLAERLPLSAAVRQTEAERYGGPWRLVFIGDPLYRVIEHRPRKPRLGAGPDLLAVWPPLADHAAPKPGSEAETVLRWALDQALCGLVRNARLQYPDELPRRLLSIDRVQLASALTVTYDALLAEMIDRGLVPTEAQTKLAAQLRAEPSSPLRRRIAASRMTALQQALAHNDLPAAAALWEAWMRSDAPLAFKRLLTERVGQIANTRELRGIWRQGLLAALRTNRANALAAGVETELRRLEREGRVQAPRREAATKPSVAPSASGQ